MVAGKPAQQTGSDYLNEKFGLKLAGGGQTQTFARPFSREPGTAVWVGRVGTRPPAEPEDEAIRRRIEMRGRVNHNWLMSGYVALLTSTILGRSFSQLSGGSTSAVPSPWPRSKPPDWYSSIKKEMESRFNAARGRLIVSRVTDVSYMAMSQQP